MRTYIIASCLMILLGFSGAYRAEAASVSECIAQSDSALSCIGEVTKACLATEVNPVDDIVHECYQSEYVQWNLIVIKAARDLEKRLKGDALETFRAAQKAWKIYRTKSCRLPYQTLKGRAALVAGLACNRNLTARRALGLTAFLKAFR